MLNRNQNLNTPFRHAGRLLLIAALLCGSSALLAQAAGDGTRKADRIKSRVESQETASSSQKKAQKEVADAAKTAGDDNPDDAGKVEEAVEDKIDALIEKAQGGANGKGSKDKELEEWLKKLKRDLMDKGYLQVTDATRTGEAVAERVSERVDAEKTSSSAERSVAQEISKAAVQAGKDNPDNPAAVRTAVRNKIDEIRNRRGTGSHPGGANNGQLAGWLDRLKASLMDGEYVYRPVPEGSRVLLTGVVTAGETATASVVGPDGAMLAGVVVDVNGEEYATDENGRIRFVVPATATALAATLPAMMSGAPTHAQAVAPSLPETVQVSDLPSNPTPGSTATIEGEGFDGVAEGNSVQVGNHPAEVLASSPNEMIVRIPTDAPTGLQPVTVSNANGTSEPVTTEVTRIWFESADTSLHPGQRGMGFIRVSCADPKTVQVRNLSDSIALDGGETISVTTSGGLENSAAVSYTANHPGGFALNAEIVQ